VTTRRSVVLVVSLIFAAVALSFLGVAAAYLVVARGPTVEAGSALLVRVGGELEDSEPRGVIGQLFAASRPTVRSLVASLRKAKTDPRIAGLVLAPSSTSALWGKIQEVRDAVLDFKRSGKPTVAYLEFATEREYYLATSCDRIYLAPTSPLNLTGLATYEVFLRGLLDKIGVYPDLVHVGDYKTAVNTFTERGLTPAHREMLDSLTEDLYDQLVRAVAEARRKSEADVRALLDRGPFLPHEAVRVGLVDDLAYEDELDEKAKLGGGDVPFLEERQYRGVELAGAGLGRRPRIAVIYGSGLIVSGESRFDGPGRAVLGSRTLVQDLRTARADRSIRAIVLRIDSPGGSFVASDAIWREVSLTRKDKPLIVSMADVAASGGYYIAMPATRIVAHPGTLTGSIGVYAGKFAVGGALEKLGLRVDSVSRGRSAEMDSPVRPYSPTERARLEAQVQAAYESFVGKAAEARGVTPEEIDAVAQGRVWTGRQAKALGLVDELGGLDRAIALAKAHAGIPPATEVELVVFPERRGLAAWLADLVGTGGTGPMEWWLQAAAAQMSGPWSAAAGLFRRGEPLALMPLLGLQ
jgi:protease-4